MPGKQLDEIVTSVCLDFARFRAFSLDHPEYNIFNKDEIYDIFPSLIKVENGFQEIDGRMYSSRFRDMVWIELEDLQKESIAVIAAELSEIYSNWFKSQLSDVISHLDYLKDLYQKAVKQSYITGSSFPAITSNDLDKHYSFKWELPNIAQKILMIGELSEEILKSKECASLEEEQSLKKIAQNYRGNSNAIKKELNSITKLNNFRFTLDKINYAKDMIYKLYDELNEKPEILNLIGTSVFYFIRP